MFKKFFYLKYKIFIKFIIIFTISIFLYFELIIANIANNIKNDCCTEQQNNSKQQDTQQATQDTQQSIQIDPKQQDNKQIVKEDIPKEILVCGISPDNPPYEYINESGEIVGIEVEIIKLIAEKLNMELEIKNIDFNGLISALIAKNIDIAISNITKTNERKKIVDFSKSYLHSKNALFYLNKNHDANLVSNIGSSNNEMYLLNLLKDKTVGTQISTTWFDYAQSLQNKINFELKGLPSNITLVQELKNSNIDYLILDELQAEFICKNVPNTKFFILPQGENQDKKAIAFQKDSHLLEKINNILKEMLENGTIQQIIDKYKK
ncbi:MAG: ABC transporter substrate-binding protein [Rickettsiales bacterium]